MPRLFFALWPESAVRAALADIVATVELPSGRPTLPPEYHLTLAFLGDLDQERAQLAQRIGADVSAVGFELVLDQTGWWSGPGVAWLAPSTVVPELRELVAALRRVLRGVGLPVEKRSYHPHLTIARKVTAGPLAGQPFALVWPVREFALIESQPASRTERYRPLASWTLAPAARLAAVRSVQ
jgi:2'-5' RNA ligase